MTTENDWSEIERQYLWHQTLPDWLMAVLLGVLGGSILWAIIVVWFLV